MLNKLILFLFKQRATTVYQLAFPLFLIFPEVFFYDILLKRSEREIFKYDDDPELTEIVIQ